MKQRIISFFCVMAAALAVSAQVPSLINYQGRLTDATGAPVTGNKNFAVSIYDAATGGNLLYEENIGTITLDNNGAYSFQFGSAGTSNTQVTETIGTTDGTTLVYSKALTSTPVINNSITVTDGTNSWSQSAGNPGAEAAATATVTAGFVTGASITNGGSGYTSVPTVTITGNGTGATATATISSGVVTSINIISAGSGYTGGATITIAPPVIPFRVDYSGGTITATYSSAPAAGQIINATYRYNTNAITSAISASNEQWLQLHIDEVNQVPRQRIVAVPFAMRAASADTADVARISNTVMDGAITASKLDGNAITESLSNNGKLIASEVPRADLLNKGYKLINKIENQFSNEISLENAPTARSLHTAIWTGSEMIIWGGRTSTGVTNTGARYNPTTNTWVTMSLVNAPEARYYHTAIWTGSEMIIWGGLSSGTIQNTGVKYNPITDTWTPISSANDLGNRNRHTAVWTGSRMIIWGGLTNSINPTPSATGSSYDTTNDSWVNLDSANAPSARYDHLAAWTGTDMIVWGGVNSNLSGGLQRSGSIYNASSNTWSTISSVGIPTQSGNLTAVWTGTNMIVWNGNTNGSGIYNPSTNAWSPLQTFGSPSARDSHTAVWTGEEMIVWGGSPTSSQLALSDGGRYVLSSDSWVNYGDLNAPTAREKHTAIWTGSEMIIWGGEIQSTGTFLQNGARIIPGEIYFYAKF